MLPLTILLLAVWLYLLLLHGGFWKISDLHLPRLAAFPGKRVVVVVPARDEADVISTSLTSLLRQRFGGELHVILVDDGSSDGTAEFAQDTAAVLNSADKLTIIRGSSLPPGWTGKVWAMQQGWEAARALKPEYVLLTDADVEHAPDHLARLLAQAEATNSDLTSVMVKLQCSTIAEKLLVPAFVYFFFLLYPPKRIADRRSRIAGAAGGCMLVRPEALERAGAFATIRQEIIDDCSLAAQIKRAGGTLWLGVSTDTVSIRGYRTFTSIGRMIARTAFNQLQHSALLLAGCILGMLLIFVLPLALSLSHTGIIGWIAVASCLVMFASYLPILRLYKLSPLYAVTLPLAAIFYLGATVQSAINYWHGQGGLWKGRAQDFSCKADS